ncbi:MAG: YcxB family protein [Ruminococcus sp.]|nr:YcxB family protein [Ruminococcus sp.]
MEENYKLEKEYKVPFDTFREAYRAYQKKFVYPKSYIFMALFLILTADFVYAAVKDPSNYLTYILIVMCLAFAFREWFNPRKARNNIIDAVREMGEATYKIGVSDSFIDISTVAETTVVDPEDSDEPAPLPEKSRIPLDESYRELEYDSFFLLLSGKSVFYILPKEGFTESELDIIRKTGAEPVQEVK